MKRLILILALLSFTIFIAAQSTPQTKTDFNAYLTIQRGTDFNTAIKVIETLSYQYEAKKIVNSSSFNGAIAIPISQLHWKEALMLLCQTHNLNLEEKGGAYFIVDPPQEDKSAKDFKPTDKQVKISAIFFRADKTLLNTMGINWQSLVNGKVTADINFNGAGKVIDDLVQAKGSYSFENNGYVIDINALLKVIESNQKGSVIARPSISVLSGKEGFIQVGQDFSVKTADDAGNISDKFFSTGIILKVVPTVVEYEGQSVIHLTANVEKSSATPGEISTIINKNSANTEVFLFDGEETVIGGLNDIDYTKTRSGIPFLKDLPWWVFGIKYLASYSKYEQTNREMIVILKAELYDSIEKRLQDKTALKEKIDKLRNENNKNIFEDSQIKTLPEN